MHSNITYCQSAFCASVVTLCMQHNCPRQVEVDAINPEAFCIPIQNCYVM